MGRDGETLGIYEKHNPLPFFQDGRPGATYPVFTWDIAGRPLRFGATICFDLSFERNARRLARNGAAFLVVPSNEPSEWPRLEQAQHALIAPLRAVENDIGILRASTPGPSQIVSPQGVELARLAVGQDGALVSAPPAGAGCTVYNRIGWRLPWVCQLVTVLWVARCMAVAVRSRRRPARVGMDERNAEGAH